MNGQKVSKPYWVQLFEARNWSGLEAWAGTTDDDAAKHAFWERLNAEIPKEIRVNGAEQWKTHVHPSRAPDAWKGAARLLEEGELEVCVLGDPDTYAVLWDRGLPEIEALIADLKSRPEVTEGDAERSRAAYIARAECCLMEMRVHTAVARRQIDEEQTGEASVADGSLEMPEDEREFSQQELRRELIAGVAVSAFNLGLNLRAAGGKEVEALAVTGEKVLKGVERANDMRRPKQAPRRSAILENMERLQRQGHSVSNAARLTTEAVGGTEGGNRKMWYRYSKGTEK
jgi:hypothetical protein